MGDNRYRAVAADPRDEASMRRFIAGVNRALTGMYTFTKDITFGTSLGSLANQDADAVNIDGGAIDGTIIGGTTPAAASVTTLDIGGTVTIGAFNVVLDTTTGSQIGTAAEQKLAFHGATPVVQAAHIADATTAHSITDPADAPADADALREDLVANALPELVAALDALGTTLNAVILALEEKGVVANA